MPRVFVYGTLKRGFSNAAYLADAVFETTAVTAHGYSLHIVSGYPALSRSGEGVVYGELYSVSDERLQKLDDFEGVPDEYQREVIELADGTRAEAYLVPAERVRGAVRIGGGKFFE